MAITRCPYCHAIIDENDKYCNNCGTQLLFTEDEEIEEEIPGEKIIEAEVEEKDYTVDEPEDEKRPATAKDLDAEIDEELEKELREETEELALDELVAEETREGAGDEVTEEVILVDENETAEAKGGDASRTIEPAPAAEMKTTEPEALKEEDQEEEELADELEEETAGDLEPMPAPERAAAVKPEEKDKTGEYASAVAPTGTPVEGEPEIEYVSGGEAPDEAATAGEAGLRPVTFDTTELENLGKTVDLSKERIDRFLEVRAEKKPATPPPPPEPAGPLTPEPPTGALPPWASTMKGAPVFPEDTGPVETRKLRGGEPETEEEVEIFPRRRASDSTMGLPEKVSQAPLPFTGAVEDTDEGEDEALELEEEAPAEGAESLTPEKAVLPAGQVRPARAPLFSVREPEAETPARHEIEPVEESEEPAPRPPFHFSVFFKSKTFDVLFVGIFWLVALWLAASSMGLTLFAILGSMSGSMLLLYAVLVFLYFFLFKFFLGETLGDRLFRPRG